MSPRTPSTGEEAPPLWRRVLPFLLAGSLLALVLFRIDFDAFVTALRGTNYWAFFAFVFVFNVALLSADSWATAHVYHHTICPVRFREVWLIRGASYLPAMFNHHVGQGWLTYFIAKRYKASLWRVAGATLVVYATTFGCLTIFGALALILVGNRLAWLPPLLLVIGAAGLGYMLVVYIRPAFLRQRKAVAPLMELGVWGHLRELIHRIPHMCVLFLGSWLPFAFFGISIPLGEALAYIPVLMVAAALPITPQGVGTRDVLALQLFAQYAPGTPEQQSAAIAATTLSWVVGLTVVQAFFSPILMRRAQKLLQQADSTGAAQQGLNDASIPMSTHELE